MGWMGLLVLLGIWLLRRGLALGCSRAHCTKTYELSVRHMEIGFEMGGNRAALLAGNRGSGGG